LLLTHWAALRVGFFFLRLFGHEEDLVGQGYADAQLHRPRLSRCRAPFGIKGRKPARENHPQQLVMF